MLEPRWALALGETIVPAVLSLTKLEVVKRAGSSSGPRVSPGHHRTADDVARTHAIQVLVHLLELEALGGVLDLAFRGKGEHFHEIDVVAPVRTVKRLLAVHTRQQ